MKGQMTSIDLLSFVRLLTRITGNFASSSRARGG